LGKLYLSASNIYLVVLQKVEKPLYNYVIHDQYFCFLIFLRYSRSQVLAVAISSLFQHPQQHCSSCIALEIMCYCLQIWQSNADGCVFGKNSTKLYIRNFAWNR